MDPITGEQKVIQQPEVRTALNLTPGGEDRRSQWLTDAGEVDPAIALALQARQGDLFDQPPPQPIPQTPQERDLARQQEFMARPPGAPPPSLELQNTLDLRQPQMALVPTQAAPAPNAPYQMPLAGPTQQAVRGTGSVVLPGRQLTGPAMPTQPYAPDMTVPPPFSLERQPHGLTEQPVAPVPGSRKKNRAEIMRERARAIASNEAFYEEEGRELPGLPPGERGRHGPRKELLPARRERYAGTVAHPGQADLFQQMPDSPIAEPIADLEAQLDDLADPDHPRSAVYVAPGNIPELDTLPSVGVPLANFDGRNGTLIAKNRKVADELIAMRDQGVDLQEILGLATQAGTGKPARGKIAVQQRDAQGNVTRETLVETEAEADALAEQFTEGDRTGHVISATQAIRRRLQRIQQEQQEQARQEGTKKTRRTVEKIVEAQLEEPLIEEVKASVRTPSIQPERELTPERAAVRVLTVATKLRRAEQAKGMVRDVLPTDQYDYGSDQQAQRRDRELFDRLSDAVSEFKLAASLADFRRAGDRIKALRQLLLVHRLNSGVTTPSERVTRVARQLAPKSLRRHVTAMTQDQEQTVLLDPELETSSLRQRIENVPEEDLLKLPDYEVDELFITAANIAAGAHISRQSTRKAGTGTRETYEAGALTTIVPSDTTVAQIVSSHPSRSERIKFISRTRRAMEKAKIEQGKTTPITATATTVKETVIEEGEQRRTIWTALRQTALRPQWLFDRLRRREISQEDLPAFEQRVRSAYKELDQRVYDLMQTITKVYEPAFDQLADTREERGNPPHPARDLIYGRAYLRALYSYAKMAQALHPQSDRGLQEVERLNLTIKELKNTPEAEMVKKLAELMKAEARVQAKAATHAMGKTSGKGLATERARRAMARKYNKGLANSIANAKFMHDKWHGNARMESVIAPLMQKLVGWVTHDTSLVPQASERRGLGYSPTFNEMRNLRHALQALKQEEAELYTSLRDWFETFGYKFDKNGDLLLTKGLTEPSPTTGERSIIYGAETAQEYQYVQPPPLARYARAAFHHRPLNANQIRRGMQLKWMAKRKAAERARRAALTPAQRRREDLSLAKGIEKARRDELREARKHLPPEIRAALEAQDRQMKLYNVMDDRLNMEVSLYGINQPAIQKAAAALRTYLDSTAPGYGRAKELNAVLKEVGAALPFDHPYLPLINRLIELNMTDAVVAWDDGSTLGRPGTGETVYAGTMDDQIMGTGGRKRMRAIFINKAAFDDKVAKGIDPSLTLIHTLLHEATHAATAGALRRDMRLRTALRAVMHQAAIVYTSEARGGHIKDHYGFAAGNVDEFVTEAFTNPAFQDVLRSLRLDAEPNRRTVWQHIVALVRQALGLPDTRQVNNVLDIVLSAEAKLFTGEFRDLSKDLDESLRMLDPPIATQVGAVYNKLVEGSRHAQDMHNRATNALTTGRERSSGLLLMSMTMDQIKTTFANAFRTAKGSPLSRYMDAFFQRNSDTAKRLERADVMSRDLTRMEEQDAREGTTHTVELSRIMTESTLYGIHGDRPLSHEDNEHVSSRQQQDKHAELARRFKALPGPHRAMYEKLRQYYAETFREEVDQVTINSLRAMLDVNVSAAQIRAKKLDTVEGLEKEYGDQLTQDQRKIIARTARLPHSHIGPYFPLSRYGEYVVTASHVVERKTFTDKKAANQYVASQRASDPTLTVHKEETETGFIVEVRAEEVRFAETASEAEQHRQEMVAQYGVDSVDEQIQKRSQLVTRSKAITDSRSLNTLLGKLKGNPAAQAAIKDFYLRSVSDGAFRKREIKRANRRGVDYDTQHRTFANYAKSSSYYISQLEHGWKMSEAIHDMDQFAREVASGDEQSTLTAVRLQEVLNEVSLRDKMMTDPIEVSKFVRAGGVLSQFMMLSSPSYWLINLSQPYMVTLPWLAARSTVGEATAALSAAQKLIAQPLLNMAGTSWGGLKALWSKSSAEEAYSVIDKLIDPKEGHLVKRLGAEAAKPYLKMLEELRRASIIDMTMQTELRDIAEGMDASRTQGVIDASRIMSHLTEVNNRVLTAIAAFDLGRNVKKMSDFEATEFAKQAVSVTQFNYSAGNSPRLFQARGPLGSAGPLVFQFMKYPQHMYALMIDSYLKATSNAHPKVKKQARDTLIGLGLTHLAAGGVIGAMIQPAKWFIGAVIAAFSDEEDWKDVASNATFDRAAREFTTGAFADGRVWPRDCQAARCRHHCGPAPHRQCGYLGPHQPGLAVHDRYENRHSGIHHWLGGHQLRWAVTEFVGWLPAWSQLHGRGTAPERTRGVHAEGHQRYLPHVALLQ